MAFNIMDLFGYKNKPYSEGTWGPDAWWNPAARDYGYTEMQREAKGLTPSAEVETKYNNPAVYQELVASGAPLPSGYNTSSVANVDTTDKDKKDTSGTATPKGDFSLEDLIGDLERQKLEKQREDQLAMIRANLASGRQYYNDAFSGLERKRGEFQQRHDDDLDDLMTTYGGDIADLQATAEGSDARLANAALAQGISGSGLDELLRRNEVSKQRQLGTARETRQSNERANTAALNENFNWALGQEEAINRAREDLESQARLAENTTWSNFQNTLGDLITQSLANKQALQASGLGVGNYQNLAANLLGSGIDTGALTNAFNSTMGATQNNSQSINPQYANMSLLDQEKRQKGLIV